MRVDDGRDSGCHSCAMLPGYPGFLNAAVSSLLFVNSPALWAVLQYMKEVIRDGCEQGPEPLHGLLGSGEGQAKRKPRTCTIHPPAEPWR